MKVLQICYKLPFPGHDGGEYSLLQSALGLLKQEEIDLTILAIHQIGKSDNQVPKDFIKKTNFTSINVNTKVTKRGLVNSLFSKKSYLVSRYQSKKFESEIISILQKQEFDIIQIEHVYLGLYIDTIRKYSKAKIVLRTQNIEYQLWESIGRITRNPIKRKYLLSQSKKLKKWEVEIFPKVDAVITLTNQDEQLLKKNAPLVRTITIPVAFEFDRQKKTNIANHKYPKFYFIGSFDWLPNIQGITWLMKEILPVTIKRIPEIEIHIAGKKIPKSFFKFESKNLKFHPEIADAKTYVSEMDVLLVPLISGGGMKIKIMEALCLGKKVIGTKESIHGFEKFVNSVNSAENSAEFIHLIEKVFLEFQTNCESNSEQNQLIWEEFDNNSTGLKMTKFYKSLF